MKKLILILITIFAFAAQEEYLDLTNKIVSYKIKLENITEIEPPFEIKRKVLNFMPQQQQKKVIRKIIKIELISIFNNKAYVLIREYLGDQLIKTTKKWIKRGDKIGECKVIKITIEKLYLKCKNKILVKSINKKIPFFKESK